MSVNAFAQLINANLADPYTQVRLSGAVCIEGIGPDTPYPWTTLVAVDTTEEDMNAAMIAAATAAALDHGFTVDQCRLASAASPDLTSYATDTEVASAISAATSGLATSSAMTAAIATATSGLPTTGAMSTAIGTAVTGLASSSSVTAAIAAATSGMATTSYADSGDAARLATPGAGAAVTLALSTARQASTSRPVLVTATGTWTAAVTASGTLTLQSDSGATPTTPRVDAQPAVTLALGVGLTVPWSMSYLVPAGHYYRLVTGGTGTFSITRINETTL